jgi:hypothetical protein
LRRAVAVEVLVVEGKLGDPRSLLELDLVREERGGRV